MKVRIGGRCQDRLEVVNELIGTNVCREKGSLLSFVYKFGQVACRRC